jgi:predicted DNA-binding ribbon-helix-helix protein
LKTKSKTEVRKSSETPGGTVKTSVRVPRATWDRVRMLAIRRGVTAQALIVKAIERILKEAGGER